MRRSGAIYISLLLTVSVTSSAGALDLDPVTSGVPLPGDDPQHLALAGNYALLASGTNGIRVLNLSNPGNPQSVATIPTSNALDLALLGSDLYVADGDGGLKIFDKTNIESPNLISTLPLSNCQDIEVTPTHAYLGRGDLGLTIVDISDRSNPQIVSSVQRRVNDVAYANGCAYLAASDGVVPSGLITVDVTNPAQPRPTMTNAGSYFGPVIAYSNHLYAGTYVFDVSTPTNPVQVANPFEPTDAISDRQAREGYLVVGDFEGTRVFDVSNPASPFRVAFVPAFDPVVAVSWPYVYSANRTYGGSGTKILSVADLRRPANPQRAAVEMSHPTRYALAVSGDYAYVLGDGLEVIDVQDALNPVRVHRVPPFGGTHLAVSGQRLYVGHAFASEQLWIFDLANPAVPVQIGYIRNWYFADMAVSSNWVFMIQEGALMVLDATDPMAIREVAGINGLPGSAWSLAHRDNLLCYSWYEYGVSSGFVLIDVGEPANPRRLGTYNSPAGFTAADVVLGSNFVCFSGRNGIEVVDTSAPESPQLIGSLDGSYGGDLEIHEQYLYTTGEWFHVIDLIDLSRPRRVGGNSSFNSGALAVENDRLYSVGFWSGYFAVLDPFQPLRLDLRRSEASPLELTVSGPPRQTLRVQASSNAVEWFDWTSTSSPDGQSKLPITPDADSRFYRAVWP